MPAAISPLASAATSAANVAEVTSVHRRSGPHRRRRPVRARRASTATARRRGCPGGRGRGRAHVRTSRARRAPSGWGRHGGHPTLATCRSRRPGTPPRRWPEPAEPRVASAHGRPHPESSSSPRPGAVLDVIADFERLPGVGARGQVGDGAQRGRRRLGRPGRVPPQRRRDQGQLRPRVRLGHRRGRHRQRLLAPGAGHPAQGASTAPTRWPAPRRRHRGHLRPRGRPHDPDDRHAQAQGREGHHRHGPDRAQEAREG